MLSGWARLQLRAPSIFQLHTVICLECYSENTGATGGIIFAYLAHVWDGHVKSPSVIESGFMKAVGRRLSGKFYLLW